MRGLIHETFCQESLAYYLLFFYLILKKDNEARIQSISGRVEVVIECYDGTGARHPLIVNGIQLLLEFSSANIECHFLVGHHLYTNLFFKLLPHYFNYILLILLFEIC